MSEESTFRLQKAEQPLIEPEKESGIHKMLSESYQWAMDNKPLIALAAAGVAVVGGAGFLRKAMYSSAESKLAELSIEDGAILTDRQPSALALRDSARHELVSKVYNAAKDGKPIEAAWEEHFPAWKEKIQTDLPQELQPFNPLREGPFRDTVMIYVDEERITGHELLLRDFRLRETGTLKPSIWENESWADIARVEKRTP